jgi:hypothetical protein
MIIDKNVMLKISKKTITYYKSRGYDCILGEYISVKVSDLQVGSHVKINAQCDICGSKKKIMYQKYIKNIKNQNIYSCSSKCSQFKVKKTSMDKFGTEYYTQTVDYINRVKRTNIQKYGTEYALSNEDIKMKISKTNLERYGHENPFSSPMIIDKIHKTNFKKYGNVNPSKNKEVIDRIKKKVTKSWENKYMEYYKELDIIDYNNGVYKILCVDGHTYDITKTLLANRRVMCINTCTVCFPVSSNRSQEEKELLKFIESIYDGDILENSQSIIHPLELDIYLPDKKMAFEYNGLFWHSELNKSNNYHLNKSKQCEMIGVNLVHVWEDDWKYKQEIVKSIIRNKLGLNSVKIFARKCYISVISYEQSKKFLEENHLQGSVNSKYRFALIHDNEIVSVMCFGKSRKPLGENGDKYELTRFASKLNTNVLGGASKLLNHFIRKYMINGEELISYYDKSFGFNNFYESVGFEYLKDTNPGYSYIIDGIRHNRYNYNKSSLVKQGYDPSKTEHEIMKDRKIYRIYDAGNIKYIYKL